MPDAAPGAPAHDQAPISPRAWFSGALAKRAASNAKRAAYKPPADKPAGDDQAAPVDGGKLPAGVGKLPAASEKLPTCKEGKVLHPNLINPNILKTQ